jgi:hypothetical protein
MSGVGFAQFQAADLAYSLLESAAYKGVQGLAESERVVKEASQFRLSCQDRVLLPPIPAYIK